jgi:hypothetical protein
MKTLQLQLDFLRAELARLEPLRRKCPWDDFLREEYQDMLETLEELEKDLWTRLSNSAS